MKKKLITLIAGLSLVSASSFAGELTSLTSEAVLNDFDGGLEQVEWTLGKGSYKIDDTYKFTFDVDKDYITDNSGAINPDNLGAKYQGWDTRFGIVQTLGKKYGWDTSLSYYLEFDDLWDTKTGEKSIDNRVKYIVSPYFSKDIKIGGKVFSTGIELWAQVGGKKTESLKNKSEGQLNFYLTGNVIKSDLELGVYNYNKYNGTSDSYDYVAESDLKLTTPLMKKGNITINVENYIDVYSNVDTEYSYVDAYLKPIIKYTKKADENTTWYGSLGYEAFNYYYEKSKGKAATRTWDDNEMEITLGFIVK